MPPQTLDLFVVAAEPSADKHGFEIIQAILTQTPSYNVAGVLGPKMRQLPIKCLMPMERLQVMGFLDVVWAFPKIIFWFFWLKRIILKLNPKAILFIDYPEFNLRLERSLKKSKYKGQIFHHISPTIWAWNKKRLNIMNKAIDHLFTIFPFEKKYYKEQNFSVSYVGHPLVYAIQNHTYKSSFNHCKKKILSIFPGSRDKEIYRNFPMQLKCAKILVDKYPDDLELVISFSSQNTKKIIQNILNKHNVSEYTLCNPEHSYDLMKSSYMAIATSGTITLELALHHIPTVVTFSIQLLDLMIAQKVLKIDLPFFCIVNIICQNLVFTELFGPNFTENRLFFWLEKIFTDANYRDSIVKQCQSLQRKFQNINPTNEISKKILCEMK